VSVNTTGLWTGILNSRRFYRLDRVVQFGLTAERVPSHSNDTDILGDHEGTGRHSNRTNICRLHLKCDGTRAETRFRLSAKRTNPFKSAGASVQSTTGSRGVRISGSNAGYTMFRGSVKSTGYPLHLPVSPSLPLPCVTLCHHISTGLYRPYRGSPRHVTTARSSTCKFTVIFVRF